MKRWLQIARSQRRESTKDNENMELELSVSGINSLQTEQCASTSSGVRSAKKRKYYPSYLIF